MRNAEVAELLYNISELLELKGENIFKIRAYERAARAIEGLTEDIDMIASEKKLEEIPGVGASIAEKIGEYLRTGRVGSYEELKNQVPHEMIELLSIQGMGPKTVHFLYEKLKIKSVGDLEKAAREHRLKRLPRFGAKKEENILKSIKRYRERSTRIPIGTALPVVEEIIKRLRDSGLMDKIEAAGSLRRRKETVGDIDILATSNDTEAAIEAFVRLPGIKEILGKGPTKVTVITKEGIQADLRMVERRSFGTSLQYFTGSKEHNIKIRELAKQEGFKLSEYELEEISTGRKLYYESDDDVYEKLGLVPIPPELREDNGEIEAALSGNLPELVKMGDIKGDLHVHTDWSEGKNSIPEMAKSAKDLGYEYIAITDHSKALGVAHGMNEEKLLSQIAQIHKLNDELDGFRIFSGIEVDIRADSSLDFDNSVLKQCDIVVAAIHSGMNQSRREITGRLVSAMENEHVDIIAHPTGRIMQQRQAYDVDIDVLLDAAADTGTALEINAHPMRLDLNDINSRKAKNRGVLLSIGTDAHKTENLGLMKFGVDVARRGWLERKNILNTYTANELMN